MSANQITRAYALHHEHLAPARAALRRAAISDGLRGENDRPVLIVGETQLPGGELSVRPAGTIDPVGLPGCVFIKTSALVATLDAWAPTPADAEAVTPSEGLALWQALVAAAVDGAHLGGPGCACIACRWERARVARQNQVRGLNVCGERAAFRPEVG